MATENFERTQKHRFKLHTVYRGQLFCRIFEPPPSYIFSLRYRTIHARIETDHCRWFCCQSPNPASLRCVWLVTGKQPGLHGRLLNYNSHPSQFSWKGISFLFRTFDNCCQMYGSRSRSDPYQTEYASHHAHHGRCVVTETIFHPL